MTTILKRGLFAVLSALLLSAFSLSTAHAQKKKDTPRDAPNEIWVSVKEKWDYAANGYDVTSYFTTNEAGELVGTETGPVKGNPEFAATVANGTYIFASQENLDKFLASPDSYKPQYGGHCAYAAGRPRKGFFVYGDPEAWHVYQGKLYFNLKTSIQTKWLKNKDGYIAEADPRWAEKYPTSSPAVAGSGA